MIVKLETSRRLVSSSIGNGGCVAGVTREQRKCGEDDKAGLGWSGASINNNNLVLDSGYRYAATRHPAPAGH